MPSLLPQTQQAIQQRVGGVRMGIVDGRQDDDLVFALKPERIDREEDGVYVPVPLAAADFAPGYTGPPPVTWARNNPERLIVEGLLVDDKTLTGSGAEDVEDAISKMENFRRRNARTKEPPELFFTVGVKTDRVRLERLSLQPKIWTTDLKRRQVRYSMQLIVIKPGA